MMERFNEISTLMGDPPEDADFDALMTEMGELQEKIDAVDGWSLDNQLEIAMDALRCPPATPPSTTCRRREAPVALTKLLLEKPDILLLDEPTNHLDAESVQWLEKHLVDYAGNVILVTHDRYFLDNVVNWVLELDRGRYYIYEAIIRLSREESQAARAGEREDRASRRRSRRSSTGSAAAPRPARPSQGAIRAFDELVEAQENRTPARRRSYPGARAPRRQRDRSQRPDQGLRRQAALRELSFTLPPGGSSA
jgi:ATPase subunit of ABC transporter with duplicated ATPase domains